jgi:hypothetical protein
MSKKTIINPEYLDAIYEYRFLKNGQFVNTPWPIRGNEIIDGKIVSIPPTIEVNTPEADTEIGDESTEDD